MALKVIGVVEDKYMGTEIDSLYIHFDDTKTECLVDEFDVPLEYDYMVYYTTKVGHTMPSWVEIVDPAEVIRLDNPPLPDWGPIQYNGEKMTLHELIKKIWS